MQSGPLQEILKAAQFLEVNCADVWATEPTPDFPGKRQAAPKKAGTK